MTAYRVDRLFDLRSVPDDRCKQALWADSTSGFSWSRDGGRSNARWEGKQVSPAAVWAAARLCRAALGPTRRPKHSFGRLVQTTPELGLQKASCDKLKIIFLLLR